MKKANNELHLSITLVMSLSFLAQCIKIFNNLYMNFNLVVTLPTPQLLAKAKNIYIIMHICLPIISELPNCWVAL